MSFAAPPYPPPAAPPRFAPAAARRLASELAVPASLAFDPQGRPARGPIRVVDLFCGCGGLSCGFEVLGRHLPSYGLAYAADLDAAALASYAANLPLRPERQDLAQLAANDAVLDQLRERLPPQASSPLVLVGGPPCQGFSAHGKGRVAPDDPRNDLVGAFATIAVALRPDLVLMENVPELLSEKHWAQFARFRALLQGAGYQVRARICNLAGYGVPQERFRALVVASRRPCAMPAPLLSPDQYRSVRQAIGELPPIAPGQPCADDPMHVCSRHRAGTVETIRQVPLDGGSRPRGVGPACLDRVDGFRDVYGRLSWNRPANTITGYARNPASGRFVHPEQHRALSIREAALLQGFPRRYAFEGPFDGRFQQIGNAVPPIFATSLAAHFLGELLDPALPSQDCTEDQRAPTSDSFSSGIAGRKQRGR